MRIFSYLLIGSKINNYRRCRCGAVGSTEGENRGVVRGNASERCRGKSRAATHGTMFVQAAKVVMTSIGTLKCPVGAGIITSTEGVVGQIITAIKAAGLGVHVGGVGVLWS